MTWRLPGGASDQARSPARTCFQKAITLAQRQQAKTFELRAAMSLARLWQGQGETAAAAAHRILSAIHGWFTEGFETRDLQDAGALCIAMHQVKRS